ncbi:MAG: hydrogenase maturation nickel metallochaperone HypA [Kiritimatiellaeota bacterium]|nr:hydrogenase maturation nickel metallochaperone HypA [Kiritimatiellota bacterium]
MHEFSICEQLVRVIGEELARVNSERPVHLLRARVAVGRLRQIVPENLRFAFEVLTRDTPAEGASLELREIPVTATCGGCGWHGEVEPNRFVCPECGGTNLEAHTGRELFLESLEIEDDEPDNHQSLS